MQNTGCHHPSLPASSDEPPWGCQLAWPPETPPTHTSSREGSSQVLGPETGLGLQGGGPGSSVFPLSPQAESEAWDTPQNLRGKVHEALSLIKLIICLKSLTFNLQKASSERNSQSSCRTRGYRWRIRELASGIPKRTLAWSQESWGAKLTN